MYCLFSYSLSYLKLYIKNKQVILTKTTIYLFREQLRGKDDEEEREQEEETESEKSNTKKIKVGEYPFPFSCMA